MNKIIPKYINYGSNNLFPQIIAELAIKSPTNHSAIKLKTMMTRGEGIDLSKVNNNLRKLLNNLTENGKTIDDLLHKISRDYVIFGGFALKVTWGNDGYIKYLKHIPFEYVRVGEPIMKRDELQIPYYVVSNNWDTTLSTQLETLTVYPKFDPNYFGKDSIPKNELGLPTPTEEQVNQSEQILYCYDSRPKASNGMNFYPVPDYMSAFDAIGTEITSYQKQLTAIENYNRLPNLTVCFVDGNDKYNEYVKIIEECNNISNYVKNDSQIWKQEIILSHKIPANLLNDSSEVSIKRKFYHEFQQTVIELYQQTILNVLNDLIKYMSHIDKLEIIKWQIL